MKQNTSGKLGVAFRRKRRWSKNPYLLWEIVLPSAFLKSRNLKNKQTKSPKPNTTQKYEYKIYWPTVAHVELKHLLAQTSKVLGIC